VYFGLTNDVANVIVGDGRYELARSDALYDLVCLDAYRQPYVPFHLATVEYFEEVANHLSETGVVAVNAGRTDDDFRLVDALTATLRQVFATVVVVDVDRYDNSLIFATNSPASVDGFIASLGQQSGSGLLPTVAQWALERGNIRLATSEGPVLTDDHAPVEWIIDQIILDEAVREDP
jgi:hypothetical protein